MLKSGYVNVLDFLKMLRMTRDTYAPASILPNQWCASHAALASFTSFKVESTSRIDLNSCPLVRSSICPLHFHPPMQYILYANQTGDGFEIDVAVS